MAPWKPSEPNFKKNVLLGKIESYSGILNISDIPEGTTSLKVAERYDEYCFEFFKETTIGGKEREKIQKDYEKKLETYEKQHLVYIKKYEEYQEKQKQAIALKERKDYLRLKKKFEKKT